MSDAEPDHADAVDDSTNEDEERGESDVAMPDTTDGGDDDSPDSDAPTCVPSSGAWLAVGAGQSFGFDGTMAVAVGKDALFYGGAWLNSSSQMVTVSNGIARVDPEAGTSTPIPLASTPPCSWGAIAWTGEVVLVYGCAVFTHGEPEVKADGHLYAFDPTTQQWATQAAPAFLTPRSHPKGVWTGARFLVWGGLSDNASGPYEPLADGVSFDPKTGVAAPISTVGAPSPRFWHTAVWTGTRMIVWGGVDVDGHPLGDGGAYDPDTDIWEDIPASNSFSPSPRGAHTAVWTGSRMIVWGGTDSFFKGGLTVPSTAPLGDGAAYDPATRTWGKIGSVDSPAARFEHGAVWTGCAMLVWGGYDGNGNLTTSGASYDPVVGTWTATSDDAAPDARGATLVWTAAGKAVAFGSAGGGIFTP